MWLALGVALNVPLALAGRSGEGGCEALGFAALLRVANLATRGLPLFEGRPVPGLGCCSSYISLRRCVSLVSKKPPAGSL